MTIPELKEYVDSAVAAQRREQALIQVAVDTAAEAMNRRLEGMNEFRQQLNDQKATFVTKEMQEQVENRLVALETFANRFWGVILAAMFMSGLISYLVEKAMGK